METTTTDWFSVILVQDNKTKEKQVLKLFKPTVKTAIAEAEARLLLSLNHPRILSASGYFPKVIIPQPEDEYPIGGEVQCHSALALELVPNGELLDLIRSFGSFTEAAASSYFLQLVDAIEYLHNKEICHLDIKPDNILVDENYNLKLADLGVAAGIPKDCLVKGKVGTVLYHAPEMHLDRPYNTYQADLFALGITLFTMVSGHMPFNYAKAGDPLYNLIIEGKFEEFWTFHESARVSKTSIFSKNFKSLIEAMLAFNVNNRLSLEQIKQHAWVRLAVLSEEKSVSTLISVFNKPSCAEEVEKPQVPSLGDGLFSATC